MKNNTSTNVDGQESSETPGSDQSYLESSYHARRTVGKKQQVNTILQLLNDGKPHKAAAIAFELGVNSRTVRRTMHYMRDRLKLPIEATREGFLMAEEFSATGLNSAAA